VIIEVTTPGVDLTFQQRGDARAEDTLGMGVDLRRALD
jgi:hypothetical protein